MTKYKYVWSILLPCVALMLYGSCSENANEPIGGNQNTEKAPTANQKGPRITSRVIRIEEFTGPLSNFAGISHDDSVKIMPRLAKEPDPEGSCNAWSTPAGDMYYIPPMYVQISWSIESDSPIDHVLLRILKDGSDYAQAVVGISGSVVVVGYRGFYTYDLQAYGPEGPLFCGTSGYWGIDQYFQ